MHHKIAIIGVGLLGGSLGLALQQRGVCVTGYFRSQISADAALQLGIVTHATTELKNAVSNQDIVILCTPIAQMPPICREILPYLNPHTIVSDVGSTKKQLVQELHSILSQANCHYVGAHPMAGSEKIGMQHATANLFQNALCLLTPTKKTNQEALRTIEKIWYEIGCRTQILSPEEHDRLVCRASHLPHLLAAALVRHVLGATDPREATPEAQKIQKLQNSICASGFRDTTRVASGSPEMWRDIIMSNREEIYKEITAFRSDLDEVTNLVQSGTEKEIYTFFTRARNLRNNWIDQHRS